VPVAFLYVVRDTRIEFDLNTLACAV
jgi:hypothetical protein